MNRIGADSAMLRAICLTHEHDDHKSAVGILHRKLGLKLYANGGTVDALERSAKYAGLPWNLFSTGQAFEIGSFMIEPFGVPHDSCEPVGFAVTYGGLKVGIATDMGMATDVIRYHLSNCDVLVLEANHDEEMLRNSDRPWPLKQRIAGRQGHLSNRRAADLIAEVAGKRLQSVVLAHISSDCNTPHVAHATVSERLAGCGLEHIDIKVSYANRPSDVIRID
jgi:phosphoribosyl 1,2-cyclic phosphodiesterase